MVQFEVVEAQEDDGIDTSQASSKYLVVSNFVCWKRGFLFPRPRGPFLDNLAVFDENEMSSSPKGFAAYHKPQNMNIQHDDAHSQKKYKPFEYYTHVLYSMPNANKLNKRVFILISIVSALWLKNLYDGAHYSALHAALSSPINREIELEAEPTLKRKDKNLDDGIGLHGILVDDKTDVAASNESIRRMANNGHTSAGAVEEGTKNSDAQNNDRRADIFASDSDVASPATDYPPLLAINETWYPSDEWVHSCAQDLSSRTEAEGEWDIPHKIALADCIKFCRCYHRSLPNTTFNNLYYRRSCPLTFSFPDDKKAPGDFNLSVIDEVHEIQSHYPYFTIPEPEALVVHLRLGDIVESSPSTVEEILISGADPGYPTKKFLNSIKSIHELLDNIHSSKAKTVHIVGGTHRKEYWQKSRIYAGCLHRAIETAGYNVTMRLEGTHPDVDFYYISHASQLVV